MVELVVIAILLVLIPVAFYVGRQGGKNVIRAQKAEAHDPMEREGDCRCWDKGYRAGWAHSKQ